MPTTLAQDQAIQQYIESVNPNHRLYQLYNYGDVKNCTTKAPALKIGGIDSPDIVERSP